MKSKRLRQLILLFSLGFLYLIPTVFSSWVYFDLSEEKYVNNGTLPNVCYINKNEGGKRYTSIERALKKANSGDTVYVIPESNPVIKYDCVVKNGVSLSVIYGYDAKSNPLVTSVVDSSPTLAYENGTCKNEVRIINDAILTINGTLNIGAIQNSGNGGESYNGNATKEYTKITLSGGSTIINNGILNCYGYITSTSKEASFLANNGSENNLLYTIVEHRGGSRYAGMAGADKEEVKKVVDSSVSLTGNKIGEAKPKVFVYNRWFIDSLLDVNFKFMYGSTIKGLAVLFADNENNATALSILGNDSLIQLQNNSLLTGYFDSKLKKCSINTYGSWNLGSIKVYFGIKKKKWGITARVKINVSSKTTFLPVSHYYDIAINPYENSEKAIVNATTQSVKLLPGSSVTIKENCEVNAKDIAIYQEDSFYPNGKSIEDNTVGNSLYPNLKEASFNNYGIVNCESIGGPIYCYNNAKINANLENLTSYEAYNFVAQDIKVLSLVTVQISIPSYHPIVLNLISKEKSK